MKIERSYKEDIPVWFCMNDKCRSSFHIEFFTKLGRFSWDHPIQLPRCPFCGGKDVTLITRDEI